MPGDGFLYFSSKVALFAPIYTNTAFSASPSVLVYCDAESLYCCLSGMMVYWAVVVESAARIDESIQ